MSVIWLSRLKDLLSNLATWVWANELNGGWWNWCHQLLSDCHMPTYPPQTHTHHHHQHIHIYIARRTEKWHWKPLRIILSIFSEDRKSVSLFITMSLFPTRISLCIKWFSWTFFSYVHTELLFYYLLPSFTFHWNHVT